MFQRLAPIEGGLDGGGGKGSSNGFVCLVRDSKGDNQNCFWTNPNNMNILDIVLFMESYYSDSQILSIKSFQGDYSIFNDRGTSFFYTKVQSYDSSIISNDYLVCAADIEDGARSTTNNFGDFKSIRGKDVKFYGSIK